MKIELVKFDVSFLELTWQWLNDPEVKRLTNTPTFSKTDQRIWYDSLKEKEDYKIWGIDADYVHIGACGLKNITKFDCEYWGYIGEKEYWGRGVGTYVLKNLINLAISQNKDSVWLNVTKTNQRAIHLYTKFGFKEETLDETKLIKMRLIL